VLSVVNKLPDKQRQVIVAFYFQELKIKDIAASQQVSVGTVKSLLFKARTSLEKQLDPVVLTNAFALPLTDFLHTEFDSFSLPPEADFAGWESIEGVLGQSLAPPPPTSWISQAVGYVGGNAVTVCATALVTVGVVTGGGAIIYDAVTRETPSPAPPTPSPTIEISTDMPETDSSGFIFTLEDMLGAADAALLIELSGDSDESRDGELEALLVRHEIKPDITAYSGTGSAETFKLIRGGKRLYVIRLTGAYAVSYRFEPESEPELTQDELEEKLWAAT